MSDNKTYVKRVKTGEVFEVEYEGIAFTTVWDDEGERHVFKRAVLVPYEPEEAWEDCPGNAVSQHNGYLLVWGSEDWHPVPSPYTRTITRDGKLVVQRRRG